jgi:hypothetical protein
VHAQSHTPRYIKTQTNNLSKTSNVSLESFLASAAEDKQITYEPSSKGYSTSYGNTFTAKHFKLFLTKHFKFMPDAPQQAENLHSDDPLA